MVSELDSDQPSPQEIRATLDRMLASETFTRSPQLAMFLRFVVDMALRGDAEQIKGYTIGVEALGRPANFDPQIDPIVRVEGTRLRRTIERYYAGPGASDEVLIDLPRGSYVPSFRRRSAGVPLPTLPFLERLSLLRPHAAGLAIVAALGVAAIVGLIGFTTGRLTGPDSAITGVLRPGNGMPTLAIQQMPTIFQPAAPRAVLPAQVIERLHDAFTRFDGINIVTGAGSDVRADYQLQVTLEYYQDGATNVRLRLEDVSEGRTVWSQVYGRLEADRALGAYEGIVVDIAATLLQPFGVIRAHERVKHLASNAGDPRYRCIIEASESLRSFKQTEQDQAQDCLEKLIARDPSFAVGVRYLAAVYLRDFQYGTGTRVTDAATLDRALQSARRAIEMQPSSSRGYHTFASVLLARGDATEAIAASDRAVDLNKYDLAVLGDYAGRLIAAGEVVRGMDMLERAVPAGAVRPSTQLFYLFLGSYLRGDQTAAAQFASQITADGYSLGRVARAIAAAEAGERDRARDEAARLVAINPAWRDDPRGQLEKFFPSREVVDRLARGLAAAGIGGSG